MRPDQYIASILSDATEQDIDSYQQNLKKARNEASANLQQNVSQNRTQFIKVSKEAEKLKGEMRALSTLMDELKFNTTALRTTSQGDLGGGVTDSVFTPLSKKDKRSSVANRANLWNSQLQVCYAIRTVRNLLIH